MLDKKQVNRIREIFIDEDERLSLIFDALSDLNRLRIFKLLMEHNDVCVTDVANILNISLPTASHHFRVLEMSGLVRKERTGQMICYQLKGKSLIVKSIVKLLKEFKIKSRPQYAMANF